MNLCLNMSLMQLTSLQSALIADAGRYSFLLCGQIGAQTEGSFGLFSLSSQKQCRQTGNRVSDTE